MFAWRLYRIPGQKRNALEVMKKHVLNITRLSLDYVYSVNIQLFGSLLIDIQAIPISAMRTWQYPNIWTLLTYHRCRESTGQHDRRHRDIALLVKRLSPSDPAKTPKGAIKAQKCRSTLPIISDEDMKRIYETIHPITDSAGKAKSKDPRKDDFQISDILRKFEIATGAHSSSAKEHG